MMKWCCTVQNEQLLTVDTLHRSNIDDAAAAAAADDDEDADAEEDDDDLQNDVTSSTFTV